MRLVSSSDKIVISLIESKHLKSLDYLQKKEVVKQDCSNYNHNLSFVVKVIVDYYNKIGIKIYIIHLYINHKNSFSTIL